MKNDNTILENWKNCYEKCPQCGNIHTEYNSALVLTSFPPQYHFKCKCGHHWTGKFSTKNQINYYSEIPNKIGWICPICGVGVSPSEDHCPCCSGIASKSIYICKELKD